LLCRMENVTYGLSAETSPFRGLCPDRSGGLSTFRAGAAREHDTAVDRRAGRPARIHGYVVRRPDPRDRRAKLIVLTVKGKACGEAAQITIAGLEDEISRRLGERGHRQLRRMLEATGGILATCYCPWLGGDHDHSPLSAPPDLPSPPATRGDGDARAGRRVLSAR
jgi:hypothetical protein